MNYSDKMFYAGFLLGTIFGLIQFYFLYKRRKKVQIKKNKTNENLKFWKNLVLKNIHNEKEI